MEGQEIVFIATPTPHEAGYDGREPSSHLEPRDFDYSAVIRVIKECNQWMNEDQTLVLISTVLPGTIRRQIAPHLTRANLVYNPYLIAMGTVKADFLLPEMIIVGHRTWSSQHRCLSLTGILQKDIGLQCSL